MARRRRSSPQAHYYDYDDYGYHPRRRRTRQRGGLLGPVRRALTTALTRFFIAVSAIVFFCLVLLVAFNFAIFLIVLWYALLVSGGLALLAVLYAVVRIISGISQRLSEASIARAKAKQEHARVKQSHVRVQMQEVRLARQEELWYEQQQRRALPQERERPRAPRARAQDDDDGQEPLVRVLPVQEQPEPEGIPGMPAKNQIFYYRDYKKLLKAGELIVGIRQDGSARIGTWQDFKVLLILGSSSSGKTTTIVEKCVCAARSGGQLVVCDPHGYKPDSLLRRIHPLQSALLPGTVMAIEHADVMRNVELVKRELDRRVHGGNCDIPVFLVLEELNRLQRDKAIADELTTILQTIGQEGRGYNVYAIVAAQQITYLAEIRKSIVSFICHRVDESESRRCIPARFAKFSMELAVGQTFVKDADGVTEPLQQVLVTLEDVERQAQTLRRQAPASQPQTPARSNAALPAPPSQAAPSAKPPQRTSQPLHKTRLVQQQQGPPQTEPLQPRAQRQAPATNATWGGTSAAVPSSPQPAQPVTSPITEDLARRSLPPDIVQHTQTSIAQNKLDALAASRAKKRGK